MDRLQERAPACSGEIPEGVHNEERRLAEVIGHGRCVRGAGDSETIPATSARLDQKGGQNVVSFG
jgi:hypothetical protein